MDSPTNSRPDMSSGHPRVQSFDVDSIDVDNSVGRRNVDGWSKAKRWLVCLQCYIRRFHWVHSTSIFCIDCRIICAKKIAAQKGVHLLIFFPILVLAMIWWPFGISGFASLPRSDARLWPDRSSLGVTALSAPLL